MVGSAVTNGLRSLRKISCVVLSDTNAYGKKHIKIFGEEFVYLYMTGILTAFIGWVAENTVKLVSSGVVDSRFHLLPFISPYALIPIALHVMLGDPDNVCIFGKTIFRQRNTKSLVLSNIISLAVICGAVFVGEFVVGNLWEKLFGVRLWNYSNQPLHLTQYVSLFSALGYGTGAYLLFRFVLRPSVRYFRQKINYDTAVAVCCTLGLWIVLDTLFMCLQIVLFREPPVYWTFSFI